jgi:hypothetical protein
MKNIKYINTFTPPSENEAQLEHFIKNNLPAFDEEPATGHHERLQTRREKIHRRTKIFTISQIAAAACIATVFAVNMLWYNHTPVARQNMLLCENINDIKSCYLSKMNDVSMQIMEIVPTLDNIDPGEVMEEIDNLLAIDDEIEQELLNELSDEEATAVLIDYYQDNLENLQALAKLLTDIANN